MKYDLHCSHICSLPRTRSEIGFFSGMNYHLVSTITWPMALGFLYSGYTRCCFSGRREASDSVQLVIIEAKNNHCQYKFNIVYTIYLQVVLKDSTLLDLCLINNV